MGDSLKSVTHRGRARGTATAEALMILTVLTTLWAGVLHLGGAHLTKLSTQAEARQCAWRIAMEGCRKIPTECRSDEASGSSGHDQVESLEEAGADSLASEIADAFRELLVDQVRGLFAVRVETRAEADLTAPAVLGSQTVTVGGTFSLPCGPKPLSIDDLAEDMWERLLAVVRGDG